MRVVSIWIDIDEESELDSRVGSSSNLGRSMSTHIHVRNTVGARGSSVIIQKEGPQQQSTGGSTRMSTVVLQSGCWSTLVDRSRILTSRRLKDQQRAGRQGVEGAHRLWQLRKRLAFFLLLLFWALQVHALRRSTQCGSSARARPHVPALDTSAGGAPPPHEPSRRAIQGHSMQTEGGGSLTLLAWLAGPARSMETGRQLAVARAAARDVVGRCCDDATHNTHTHL